MSKGIDVNQSVIGHLHALQAAGISWIGRYYGRSKQQPLSKEEAQAISSLGLYVVSIWESGYPTKVEYFSSYQGSKDGADAYHAAAQAGQPGGSVIYFTVDYDAAPADLRAIEAYFRAVRLSVRPGYFVGVYGSGRVLKHLLSLGLVSHSWLADPRRWAEYDSTSHFNIRQVKNGVSLCGLEVDMDESDGSAGGWQVK